jgi:hypothetical protein
VAAAATVAATSTFTCASTYDGQYTVNAYYNPYNTSLYPYNIVPPNATLASICNAQWTSQNSGYLTSAAYTHQGDYCYPVGIQYSLVDPLPVTPVEPCCLNCTIYGGNVQVYYWPTPAPTPGFSTLTTSAGFTLYVFLSYDSRAKPSNAAALSVSPSVYVRFDQLSAVNLCGQFGTALTDVTLGFAPEDLSTVNQLISVLAEPSEPSMYEPIILPGFLLSTETPSWSSFNYHDLQYV